MAPRALVFIYCVCSIYIVFSVGVESCDPGARFPNIMCGKSRVFDGVKYIRAILFMGLTNFFSAQVFQVSLVCVNF